MNKLSGPIPRGFVRRVTGGVLLIFLVTMAIFLWAAYRSEESLLYAETFEHLEEASTILSFLPELRRAPTGAELATLEERLAERTGTRHRVLVTEANLEITAASESSLIGADIRGQLNLVPYRSSSTGRATARDSTGRWMVSSIPLDDQGNRLFLLRSRKGSEGFVSSFWKVHGLHVGVTVLLFLALLRFLGEHYVRRPIEQLAGHIRRVEGGEFQTRPERYRSDEFGWLGERFTQMATRLKEAVERLVRTEKHAAASAVALVVATEAMEPLNSLKRHVAYLEGLSAGDPDLKRLGTSIERDRLELVSALARLKRLVPEPPDPGDESAGEDISGN